MIRLAFSGDALHRGFFCVATRLFWLRFSQILVNWRKPGVMGVIYWHSCLSFFSVASSSAVPRINLLILPLVFFVVVTGFVESVCAGGANDVVRLEAALDDLDAWVGEEKNGDKWRKYLRSAALRKAMKEGEEADPAVVARALQQYRSGAKGLEKRRFVVVRGALQSWLNDLRNQHAGNLSKSVWAARGDHVPLTDEGFAPVRSELREMARRLENRLGVGSQYTENWKTYLKWSLLEPHFEEGVKISGKSLKELDEVLKRLRANKRGLEHPAFVRTAAALEKYRELAFWNALGKRRDTRKRYDTFLKELEKQLVRNSEKPSVESTRQIGKIVGLMEHLGHAPQLVERVRSEFDRPNLWVGVSTRVLNRMGQRPVSETQPVRDFILGARVRGTADSSGMLSLRTLPSADHIAIQLQLAGNIQSRTASFKKPVRVNSLGSTDFLATKELEISDARFVVMPSAASARTKTRICSIRKTGGRFGRRLVERIARKKVAESKSQAERIGARHAEQKIATKFDGQVVEALYEARQKYDEKFRPPLMRIGMFPEHLRMSSTSESVRIETTLASAQQITTSQLPPGTDASNDLNFQIHETALNNFFPHFLGGVKLGQKKESEAPKLEGDIPGWMKKLTGNAEVKKQFVAPVIEASVKEPEIALTLSEPKNRKQEAEEEATTQKAKKKEKKSDFKPWSFEFNREHPVSVSFEDQKIVLRIRIAKLTTLEDGEESVRRNWDILVTYRVIQDGNGVLLRREGEVEALPTGFDPHWFGDKRWKDKLSSKQVGVRKNLEKNLNKRAAEGQGFPKEIPIPAIELPMSGGVKRTLVLRQLDCAAGWLTLGYGVP